MLLGSQRRRLLFGLLLIWGTATALVQAAEVTPQRVQQAIVDLKQRGRQGPGRYRRAWHRDRDRSQRRGHVPEPWCSRSRPAGGGDRGHGVSNRVGLEADHEHHLGQARRRRQVRLGRPGVEIRPKLSPKRSLRDGARHVSRSAVASQRPARPRRRLARRPGLHRAPILSRLRFFDLENRWRASYAYTNFGVTAAAKQVALASGRNLSWEDLSQEIFYRPLGMTSTSGKFADFLAARTAPWGTCRPMASGSLMGTGRCCGRRRGPSAWAPTCSAPCCTSARSRSPRSRSCRRSRPPGWRSWSPRRRGWRGARCTGPSASPWRSSSPRSALLAISPVDDLDRARVGGRAAALPRRSRCSSRPRARARAEPRRGAALALAAGLLYGLSDAATKGFTAAAGPRRSSARCSHPGRRSSSRSASAAFFALQRGLQLGAAATVIVLMTAATNVIAVAAGVAVFAESFGAAPGIAAAAPGRDGGDRRRVVAPGGGPGPDRRTAGGAGCRALPAAALEGDTRDRPLNAAHRRGRPRPDPDRTRGGLSPTCARPQPALSWF